MSRPRWPDSHHSPSENPGTIQPYQALIGRLCGATECGAAFLVGDEQIVCAKSPYDDHLELWINHIVGPPADAFELLQRHGGEYRFELSGAPVGACAPTVTTK
jgi:hypothetical protein